MDTWMVWCAIALAAFALLLVFVGWRERRAMRRTPRREHVPKLVSAVRVRLDLLERARRQRGAPITEAEERAILEEAELEGIFDPPRAPSPRTWGRR